MNKIMSLIHSMVLSWVQSLTRRPMSHWPERKSVYIPVAEST